MMVAVGAAVTLAAACTTLRVRSDINTAALNTQCHSFEWAGSFHPRAGVLHEVANPVNESRLRAAIQSNLAARGVTLANGPGQADCIVGYGIGVHDVVEGAYPYGWGWGGGWGWRHGYVGGAWWDGPYVFQQGVIAIDLYDARGRVPIWHASVDQNVQGLTGADAQARIDAAVAALFTKYPGAPVATR
jgi:hypothetical protein